jgi:hypothetical protein
MWTGGPFKVRVADGRLYGRGSGDMKGGIIAYYMAFRVSPFLLRRRRLLLLLRLVDDVGWRWWWWRCGCGE